MKHENKALKRLLSMILVCAMIFVMLPVTSRAAATDVTLYLTPNSNWKSSNAWFAMYFWNDSGNKWAKMTDTDGDGIYEAVLPAGYTNVIFCRMDSGKTALDWGSVWNQTNDLTFDGNKNHYTVANGAWSKGSGTWSHKHVYASVVTPPNCTEPGYTTNTCFCGDSNTSNPADPTGHSWSDGVCGVCNAVCPHDVYTEGKCAECGMDEPAPTHYTIYFQNNWLWSDVKIYFWGSTTEENPAWPGVAMNRIDNDGSYDIYSYQIPVDVTAIIINGVKNDGSGNRDQTPNIETGLAEGKGYCMIWNNGNQVQDYVYVPSAPQETTRPSAPQETTQPVEPEPSIPVEPEETTITVYFRNDWLWPEVYIHYWNDTTGEGTAWPGVKMTKVDTAKDDGGNDRDIYSIEIPADVEGILFSGIENGKTGEDNRQKTPDIKTGIADGNAYTIHWADSNQWKLVDYTPASGGEQPQPPVQEATYVVAGNNANVFGTAWDVANTDNTMTLNGDGKYVITYESVSIGTLAFKVTDGTWDNSWGGTGADGNYELILDAISNVTIIFDPNTKTVSVAVEATGEVPVTVNNVTIHYRNIGAWDSVYGYGWFIGTETTLLGGWPGTKLTENADHKNWYTVELKDLHAVGGIGILFNNGGNGAQTSDIMIEADGEYWFDGQLLTSAPETWADGSIRTVEYEVTLHIVNAKNWSRVYLYTWTSTGANPTGGWPGTAAGVDADGFYTVNFTYTAPENQGLNFIIGGNDGIQTVDLELKASDFVNNKCEKWVVPTTADSEGKFYADIVSSANAVATGVVVSGNTVTFTYKNEGASSVEVFGTMNDWASGYTMTNNGYGVWSVTIPNVDYGIHQYKFVINGSQWIADPLNDWLYGNDANSAFLISDPNADTNTITIRVHFNAPSSQWNVCAWGAEDLAPQYDFVNGVATITIEGRANQHVKFKVRKSTATNKWAEQSGEVYVDLTGIVSGTVDVYIDSSYHVSQSLNDDVVKTTKVNAVELNYDNNTITITTSKAVSDPATAFSMIWKGQPVNLIEAVTAVGSTYTLTLKETLDLVTLYQYKILFNEQVKFADYAYNIGINGVYASEKFGNAFTYNGSDLGANWNQNYTTFVVWAPTAEAVYVNLYVSGTEGTDDLIKSVLMERKKDGNGVWTVSVNGDLNGTYYTYSVTVDGETVEAVDPYARTTGVNGKRGMVIDLDATDPDGWEEDTNPNPITSYTDAIIYELHVRDFSIDSSSGIVSDYMGKFLAFTQTGTTVNGEANGLSTGIDYLKALGVTHVHLLPVYDYGSVDETTCSNFNWGYDPVNYNVPEGSYSTDPYHGEVRVEEFKEMVMALHEAGISVIMDVVYNHVYDAGQFGMNKIVPKYFSRVTADGSYSDGSGCGNDTASEREMVRKYIVESVVYWMEEYHIDGFRFDLVGLIDVTTINTLVSAVHAKRPDVIFYGEGWNMSTSVEAGNAMATQGNAYQTPGFAYFSDSIRNQIGGENGRTLGFASGGNGGNLVQYYLAQPESWGATWTNNPQQVVQYASCHDNYTLIDKIVMASQNSNTYISAADLVKMNNLAAAIYMTSQGISFIHAGEEMLREKIEEDGGRCENSYNASDFVNSIKWDNLNKAFYDSGVSYADNVAYYQGLIAFRKTHEALRMETNAEIAANITSNWPASNVVVFTIHAEAVGDVSDQIIIIFNANASAQTVSLPGGNWNVCVEGDQAGVTALRTASGSVTVGAYSATILVQGDTHEHSYDNDCDTTCNVCGETRVVADHVYDNACDIDCNICLKTRTVADHVYDNACDIDCNVCLKTRTVADHVYDNACDIDCNICFATRTVADHVYDNACDIDCNICFKTRTAADHVSDAVHPCQDGVCVNCGAAVVAAVQHDWDDGVVTKPDCVNGGYTTYTCDTCGDVKVEDVVGANGHFYTSVYVPANCVNYGYLLYSCHCGAGYTVQLSPTGVHTAGEWEIALEATATEDGLKIQSCALCGAVLASEVIPALGEPQPTEPAPTEPAPTEPVPTEPAPTEPVPTEPAPTEPVPTEPAPTEPVPTEPVPTEPAPTEPVPTEPAPTEPVPTEPVPTEPVPTEPAPTEPVPTEPAPTEPATTAPAEGGENVPENGDNSIYLFVLLAMLTMTAPAVMILRKRKEEM